MLLRLTGSIHLRRVQSPKVVYLWAQLVDFRSAGVHFMKSCWWRCPQSCINHHRIPLQTLWFLLGTGLIVTANAPNSNKLKLLTNVPATLTTTWHHLPKEPGETVKNQQLLALKSTCRHSHRCCCSGWWDRQQELIQSQQQRDALNMTQQNNHSTPNTVISVVTSCFHTMLI